MEPVNIFTEDISYHFREKTRTRNWLRRVIERESKKTGIINIIFCSDVFLHSLNRKYLDHDSLTDIITFNHSENNESVEGDIYISLDRAADNCKKYGVDLNAEVKRLIIHGILHLVGYNDKKRGEKANMRNLEDRYLRLY